MRLTHVAVRAPFAIALAVTACSVSATTGSGDTCGVDDSIAGCAPGSFGYSCAGAATPAESSSLVCSEPTPGNGATLYCCVAVFAPTTCAPDLTIAGCTGDSQGYSCKGSDTPDQYDFTLNCSAGTASSGSTLYCCGSGDGAVPTKADAGSNDVATVLSDDGGGSDVATAPDGASDALATSDAGSGDGPSTDGVGADGAVCGVTGDTGSDSCNQCLDTSCCAALEACGTPDDAGTNDAGASACEGLLQCTLDCVAGNPDAGIPAGTLSDCEGLCNPSYTTSEQAAASALLQCLTTSCATQCQ